MGEEWRDEADRFVGYYDIMGFSRLVRTKPPKDVYQILRTFQDVASEAEALARQIRGTDGSGRALARPGRLLRFVSFSDSIVLFSRDSSDVCSLAVTLASLKLFLATLSGGFVIRGAWSCGRATADFKHSLFFGSPVIDAYELAEAQEWFGVVEHESAQTDTLRVLSVMGPDEIPLTEAYTVPLKSGARTLSAVTWPVFARSAADVAYALMSAGVDDGGPDVARYKQSTLSFLKVVRDKYCAGQPES